MLAGNNNTFQSHWLSIFIFYGYLCFSIRKDIFDISEVQYAIVETDGTLSVLLKKENQPATKSELKINTPKSSLPCIVISDGRIIKTDFAECNTDSDKIKAILKDKHLNEEDVMLMTLDKDGNINILKKDKEK